MDLRPFCFRQENKFCIWPVIRYQFDQISKNDTLCPRSLIPLYIVSYHMKWVKTSWTYSIWPDIKYSIRPYPDIQTTWKYGYQEKWKIRISRQPENQDIRTKVGYTDKWIFKKLSRLGISGPSRLETRNKKKFPVCWSQKNAGKGRRRKSGSRL